MAPFAAGTNRARADRSRDPSSACAGRRRSALPSEGRALTAGVSSNSHPLAIAALAVIASSAKAIAPRPQRGRQEHHLARRRRLSRSHRGAGDPRRARFRRRAHPSSRIGRIHAGRGPLYPELRVREYLQFRAEIEGGFTRFERVVRRLCHGEIQGLSRGQQAHRAPLQRVPAARWSRRCSRRAPPS